MNQLEYVPGIGGQSAIQLDGPSAFVGTAEGMRGREWQYELGYRDLVNANRPAREVTVTFWTDPETANDLRHAADADVAAKTPGTLIAQEEWKQRAYILAAEPRAIHYDAIEIELRIALMDGAWWRLESKQLRPENTSIDKQYTTKSGTIVTATGAVEADLAALTVYGYSKQGSTPKNGTSVPITSIESPNLVDFAPANFDAMTRCTLSGTAESITITKTASGYAYAYIDVDNPAPGNYTLGKQDDTNAIRLATYDENDAVIDDTSRVAARSTTINVTSEAVKLRIYIYLGNSSGGSAGDTATIDGLQLEKGTVANPYVTYGCIDLMVGSTRTPINLDGNFLASLPDGTQDILRINSSGDVTLEKRVGVVDLSTLTWGIPGGVQPPAVYYRSNSQSTIRANSSIPGILAEKFVQAKLQDVTNVASSKTYVISSDSLGTNYAQLYAKMSGGNSADRPTGLCYYPLKTKQEITLDPITMPTVENYDQIRVLATPLDVEITAKFETSPSVFLDYPYDYEYDFLSRSTIAAIEPSVLTPCDVRIIVYGPTDEPTIIVGENQYKVNCGVPAGAYLTIDGREKIITLTMEDGTVQNKFADGVRGDGMNSGEYIFQPIASGAQRVEWDGSFGFDLCWYEDEGEPPWKSY